MERLLILVLLCPLAWSAKASGETPEESGNAFVRVCSVVEEEHDLTNVDKANQMVCASYMGGFVEGVSFAMELVRSKGDPTVQAYCPPCE